MTQPMTTPLTIPDATCGPANDSAPSHDHNTAPSMQRTPPPPRSPPPAQSPSGGGGGVEGVSFAPEIHGAEGAEEKIPSGHTEVVVERSRLGPRSWGLGRVIWRPFLPGVGGTVTGAGPFYDRKIP